MRTPRKKRTAFGGRPRIIRDGEACKPLVWARSAKFEARNPRPAPACQDSHRLLAACGGSVPVGSPQSAYSSLLDRETKGNYKWERRWVRMGPDGRKRC